MPRNKADAMVERPTIETSSVIDKNSAQVLNAAIDKKIRSRSEKFAAA